MLSVQDLTLKADGGDADAQNELGMKFEKGLNVQKNLDQAAKYYKLSANQKHVHGSYNYARCLEKGIGTKRDLKQCQNYYKFAADEGIPEAALSLGKIYLKEKKFKNAGDYFKLAADNGNNEAQCQYGIFLQNDKKAGKERFTIASRYLEMAANNGNPVAQAHYGDLLEKGKGVRRDVKAAIRMYRMSASQSNAEGQYHLARMYENGFDIPKDENEAIKLYKLAASQKNVTALTSLALLYEKMKNYQEALPTMKNAADLGNQFAMLQYARMMEKVDPKVSYDYIQKCASLGNLEAMDKKGSMIHHGIGVQRNDAEALSVLLDAAQRGSPDAMFHYALMVRDGKGCAPDKVKAKKYLEMAANNGNLEAKAIWEKISANSPQSAPPADTGRGGGRGGRGGRGRGRGGYDNQGERDDEGDNNNNR